MVKIIGEVELATKASGSVTNNSVFLDSSDNVLKSKDSSGTSQIFSNVLVGMIIAFDKDLTGVPSLPNGFVECNGQVLSDADSPLNGQTMPDLNGGTTQRFLRGNSSSGGTGGSESHSHSTSSSLRDTFGGSLQTTTNTSTGSTSTLPSYYEIVWAIRVK